MISRRGFLVVGAGLAAAAVGGAYLARPRLRRMLDPELDLSSPPGVLDEADARTIAALGETLAAPQSVPPQEFFLEELNRLTQTQAGYLKEFQRAAALLNATAGKLFGEQTARRFESLSRKDRDAVLDRLLWRYRGGEHARSRLEKVAASREALALRRFVMRPLIEHYYRSPYGWAVVGYESYPGRPPSDPLAYTSPPKIEEAVG